MKKVMLMLVVAISAVALHAASFKWTASNIYGSDGVTKLDGTATLYAYLSTAAADTATAVATANVVAGAVKSADGTTPGYTFSDDSLVGGNAYQFYMVVEDAGKTFTSATKAQTAAATQTMTVGFGSLATATQNTSNWKSGGDVPEPTTGLLVLLGMAGLALKRKVA